MKWLIRFPSPHAVIPAFTVIPVFSVIPVFTVIPVFSVIPANAGIHCSPWCDLAAVDPGVRRDDAGRGSGSASASRAEDLTMFWRDKSNAERAPQRTDTPYLSPLRAAQVVDATPGTSWAHVPPAPGERPAAPGGGAREPLPPGREQRPGTRADRDRTGEAAVIPAHAGIHCFAMRSGLSQIAAPYRVRGGTFAGLTGARLSPGQASATRTARLRQSVARPAHARSSPRPTSVPPKPRFAASSDPFPALPKPPARCRCFARRLP